MRILHLSNFSRARCGIRNFGDQLSTALRLLGQEVTDWDIEYSHMYELINRNEPAYLPADAADYDVIHYNWHPITTNMFGPEFFSWPRGTAPLLSVYLNDIPPFSGCPFHDRADVRFAAEPSPDCHVLPYPIADWITALPESDPEVFSVGLAGVRGDGNVEVREYCATQGWPVIEPNREGWLSFEEAVRHQARATVNVQWYREGRGKSGGASQSIASRRPVLLNDSQMFSHLWGFTDLYWDDDLDHALTHLHDDWERGTLRCPKKVIEKRGWVSWGAPEFLRVWEEVRRA